MEKIARAPDEQKKLDSILAYQNHLVVVKSGRFKGRSEMCVFVLKEAAELRGQGILDKSAVRDAARLAYGCLISEAKEQIDAATRTMPRSDDLISRARLLHKCDRETIMKDPEKKGAIASAVEKLETAAMIADDNGLGHNGNYAAALFFRNLSHDYREGGAPSERPKYPRASTFRLLPNVEWQFFSEIIRLQREGDEPNDGLVNAAGVKLKALLLMLKASGRS